MLTAAKVLLSHGVWVMHLGAALRTIVACTIVGCATLYGPEFLTNLLTYPAFAYATTILIVSDATLGDTLRGTCHAFYATVQVMVPSILTLWVVGPARFNCGLAAIAVAVTAFAVGLPESTPLKAKRIAFGQIVIVYVGSVIHGAETGAVMHPVHVALSTMLGALASIVAMLVPFPCIAFYEVRKACRLYVENASERLNLLMACFIAQDNQTSNDLISKANFLAKTGITHIERIKAIQEGIIWEKPQLRFLKASFQNPGNVLQDLEMLINGMEIALTSCPTFPVSMINDEIREALTGLKLEKEKYLATFNASTTVPETMEESSDKILWCPTTCAETHDELPAFFFLSCLELLKEDLSFGPCNSECNSYRKTNNPEGEKTNNDEKNQVNSRLRRAWNGMMLRLSSENWTFALKCSLSLGFAVFFGLQYNLINGYWSGLTIAISFVNGRHATFTAANARAQATAMGSVYGILCSFIFQGFTDYRFLLLLPWIIFTSFLSRTRMYGQAGGISAVIGALLILGRKNYGSASEFAIARIIEAFIGLICAITMEILFQPARAATLARTQLSWSLRSLQDCVENILLLPDPSGLPGNQKILKSHIDKMEKFIAEAESEPNFWFHPFQVAKFGKILTTLRKMQNLIQFASCEIGMILRVSEKLGLDLKELGEFINDDLDQFQDKVYASLRFLEELLCVELFKSTAHDIESGKSQHNDIDEEVTSKIMSSFLENSREVANSVNKSKGEQKLKNQMILCLSGLGFCISNLMRETVEIHKQVIELVTVENPTNFNEILCQIKTYHTN